MSFLRGTRTYLHNIKQDDVCRMFWSGSSPYMPKASGANGSKISTFYFNSNNKYFFNKPIPPGIYFIQLHNDHKVILNNKIIIQ